MIRSLMRICIRSLIIVLLLLLLCFAFLITPYGFSTSLWLAKKIMPGQLSYSMAKGALVGPIDIDNLHYDTKQYTLKIRELKFNWNPLPLLVKTLSVQQLMINHVEYVQHKAAVPAVQKPKEASSSRFHLTRFSLPWTLKLHSAEIRDVNVTNLDKQRIHMRYLLVQGVLSEPRMDFNVEANVSQPRPIFGYFNVSGSIEHYRLKLLVRSDALRWHLTGQGGEQHIDLQTRDNEVLGGSVAGDIKLNLKEGMHWRVNLMANHLELARLDQRYPQQLSFKLKTNGLDSDHHLKAQANFDAAVPSGHVRLSAQVDKTIQARWDIAVAKLNQLWQPVDGKLISKGHFSGTLKNPETQGSVALSQLQFAEDKLHQLNMNWDIHGGSALQSRLTLTLHSLSDGKHTVPNATIQLRGNRRHQSLLLHIKTAMATLDSKIDGAYRDNDWHLLIARFSVHSAVFDDWQLHAPMHLTLKANGDVSLPHNCLYSDAHQRLCLSAASTSGKWQLDMKGSNIKAKDYLVLNYRNVRIHGKTTLNVHAQGQGKSLQQANAEIDFAKGNFTYFIDGKRHVRLYVAGKVKTLFKNNNINSHIRFDFLKKDFVQLDFKTNQASDASFGDQTPVSGKLNIAIHDLSFISNYLPSVSISNGYFKADVAISGKLGDPMYNGAIAMRTAVVSIPDVGLRLTNLAMNMQIVNSMANLTIHTLSSGNPLTISGKADFRDDKFDTQLHLTGDSALVINMPQYRVFATPDVTFTLGKHQISITGKLTIPSARLKLEKSVSVVSMPSHEVEYIGGNQTNKNKGSFLHLDFTVQLEKGVLIEAAGLAANLQGQLHLYTSKKGTILADGRIAVMNGRFSAYGHALQIADQSAVQYVQSPIDNPILNIRAYKDIKVVGGINPQQYNFENLVVGIIVTGRLSNMRVDLYSQPPGLSQEDILSYLLFGYTGGASASPGQLAGALSQGGSGLSTLPNQFQQTLGLSEFGVESQTVEDAGGNRIGEQSAFVIGKRISRQLYLRYMYNYGLYQPGSVFQIRYFLGKKWILQTDGGDYGVGADVLFSAQSKN